LAPDHPSVLNNLALAYIADGRPSVAEPLLRTAVASKGARPKIRQNLVLALGLQGKYDEAKRIAATDLSQDKAKASVAYLRKIVKLPPKAMPVAVPIPVAVAAKATRKAKAGAKVATLPPIIVQPQDRRPSLRGTARASKVARGKVVHGAIAQVGRPIQLTPTQR
jgi:tetratricopeptide (TPR) repeat protein